MADQRRRAPGKGKKQTWQHSPERATSVSPGQSIHALSQSFTEAVVRTLRTEETSYIDSVAGVRLAEPTTRGGENAFDFAETVQTILRRDLLSEIDTDPSLLARGVLGCRARRLYNKALRLSLYYSAIVVEHELENNSQLFGFLPSDHTLLASRLVVDETGQRPTVLILLEEALPGEAGWANSIEDVDVSSDQISVLYCSASRIVVSIPHGPYQPISGRSSFSSVSRPPAVSSSSPSHRQQVGEKTKEEPEETKVFHVYTNKVIDKVLAFHFDRHRNNFSHQQVRYVLPSIEVFPPNTDSTEQLFGENHDASYISAYSALIIADLRELIAMMGTVRVPTLESAENTSSSSTVTLRDPLGGLGVYDGACYLPPGGIRVYLREKGSDPDTWSYPTATYGNLAAVQFDVSTGTSTRRSPDIAYMVSLQYAKVRHGVDLLRINAEPIPSECEKHLFNLLKTYSRTHLYPLLVETIST